MQPVRPNMNKLVGAGCQMVFGVMFTVFATSWLSFTWLSGAPWHFVIIGLPFLGVGLGMLAYGAWALIIRRSLVGMAFGQASADISPPTIRVGDVVQVRYEQEVRRNLEIRGVRIQLVLREHATYRRGTNTYNVYHDQVVDQYEAPGRALSSGSLLTEECSLRIPVDSMHSLQAPRNRLIWLVTFAVDAPAAPDVREEVVIGVIPDLARTS